MILPGKPRNSSLFAVDASKQSVAAIKTSVMEVVSVGAPLPLLTQDLALLVCNCKSGFLKAMQVVFFQRIGGALLPVD